MASSPMEKAAPTSNAVFKKPSPDDEIFITGIAGYFPNSKSVKELEKNLFDKVDMISDDDRRWRKLHPEIPQRTGKVYDLEKFDASFFGVSYKDAHSMDPQSRLLMERVFECLVDAGVNPKELSNTNTGVYVGICFFEIDMDWLYSKVQNNDNGLLGSTKSMLANRISKWFGLKGPSYTVDTACSSSLYAFEEAYKAIKGGLCDSAIVCGTNLCLLQCTSLIFARLGVLSLDGKCKCFDSRGNGYVRSESVVACYLQKGKDSRRIHAKIVHAKTNCDGYKAEGITYPSGQMQKVLLNQFYSECGVSPSSIEFVEAHSTGIINKPSSKPVDSKVAKTATLLATFTSAVVCDAKLRASPIKAKKILSVRFHWLGIGGTYVGDPEEVSAIAEVFYKGRNEPLLIGSVKSNLGHAEASSGMNSIVKAIIAYNTGYVPPNINLIKARTDCPSIVDGRLKVVTEKQPWNRGLLALSSFGFGGGNAHVLLENFPKSKINKGLPTDFIPRLVCVSGRTESAVAKILDDLESRSVDVEEIRLWHSVFERDIPGHSYKGYVVLGSTPTQTVRLHRDINCISDIHTQSKILFKYTDLGTHWPAIAKELLVLPVFSAAIQRCSFVLKENNIDLFKLFGNNEKQSDYGVVGATSVYIALTDVLHSVGIKPDYITSINAGELCRAYADGCITVEQTIQAAYFIDLHLKNMLLNKTIIKCHVEFKRILENCPANVQLEYDDNQNFSVIVGPTYDVIKFADILTAQNIQVEYPGFFSPEFLKCYLKDGGINKLLSCINNALPPVMNRSKSWLSQTNDLTFTPPADNVIVIEIGLQEELHDFKWAKNNISFIPLCKENAEHLLFTLSAIGRLYQLGLNLRLANLYPEVPFPVSQSTPFLSHLIEWDHYDDWHVGKSDIVSKISYGYRTLKIDIMEPQYEYITGHTIDGRVIFPATGYLVLVWETLALMLGQLYTEMSVEFEDVYFHKATHIPKDGVIHFTVTISKGNGKFEISENNVSVVTGIIHDRTGDEKKENRDEYISIKKSKEMCNVMMNTKDFYKELNIRGYEYKGLFRGVRSCSVDGSRGQVAWNNNWVTFLDTLLQTNIVAQDTRNLYVPTRIEKFTINAARHNKLLPMLEIIKKSEDLVEFENFLNIEVSRAGGAEIRGLHVTAIHKKPPKGIPVHEKNVFIPNFCKEVLPIQHVLRSDIQFIHENIQTYKYKCIELIDQEYEINDLEPIIEKVGDVLADLPLVHAEMLLLCNKPLAMPPNITISNRKISSENNNTLFIGANLLKRQDILWEAFATLKTGCFVLSRESEIPNPIEFSDQFDILTTHNTGTDFITLIREKNKSKQTKYIQIKTKDPSFSWIGDVKKELIEGQKLVLFSENEPVSGLLGLVNCLRKEPGGEMVFGLLIGDRSAPSFNPDCSFYKEHLDKNLAINVFKAGHWGTYRHLLLDDLETIPTAHAYVNTTTNGDISSLRWWEGKYSKNRPTDPRICLVEVYCAALNFRDVMVALGRVTVDAVARGRLNQDCVQGLEFAGRTANGTRVIGFGEKCIANVVECDTTGRNLMWPVPEEWTFEEAVTVPAVYSTVYTALVLIGKMRRGESILIHAGSGGVGQAAISVALHHGLEVFTTVGTPAKRAFIKKLFPQLKDSHIGNSRNTSFEHMIQRETNGKGVDLVLNSLAEDILQATVKCLRQGGRFLEIGKYDITANTQLEMCFLQKEISFHGIMLDYIGDAESHNLRRDLHRLVLQGIGSGAVRPLTYCSFEKHEIETAYRYMAAGKHIGKVVIKIRKEEKLGTKIRPTSMMINAIPRYMCDETEVYVLIGGLGGFGLELADWLVLRGARNFLMSSRRGVSNGYQALRIRIWRSYGVRVKISTTDVTTESGCAEMLQMAAAMGPLKAVFNLAVVLNDAVFQNQSPDTFKNSFAPKALTTIHLDKLTRTICPELKDFVIFSSVSCGRGNAGQTNYGYSNSVMERICEERKAAGLPGLAIQWGAIGDVGLVADMQEENIQLEIGGTLQQKIVSCLQAMDKFLKQSSPIVSSIVVAEKRTSNTGANSVVDAIASILGISDLKTISKQAPLSEMGMDSVMAVEIKQTLERDYEIFLNAQEIRMLTFAKLSELSSSDTPEETSTTEPQVINRKEAVALGLNILVKNFGAEELASEPYIYLKSAVPNSEKENVIFLLPGIESNASTFETLCSKLNARTCVLQLGLDTDEVELDQLVNRLYRTIKTQLRPGVPFILLGYSFGSLPILGLAAKLESEGHRGLIFCLDGSPEFLQKISKVYVNSVDDTQLQNYIIYHSINTVCPNIDVHQTLTEKISAIESFEEKIKCALNLIPVDLKYCDNFLFSMAKVTYNRLKIIVSFVSNQIPVLNSSIVLVRPKKQVIDVEGWEDYGLSKLTRGEVKVHCVNAIHSNITDNEDCANILNDALLKFFVDYNSKEELRRPIGLS